MIWNGCRSVLLVKKTIRRLQRKPQFKRLVIVKKALNGLLLPTYSARLPFNFEVLPHDTVIVKNSLARLPREHRPDIEQRIRNGHLCCVARYEGQIIYAAWTAFKKCYSYALDREYEMASREAYLYGAYTVPDFRGYGIHPAVNCWRLQFLKERGYEQDLAFIEPRNKAAMNMPEKLGYDKVGITGFLEVFGIRWYFHRDSGAFSALERRSYWRK